MQLIAIRSKRCFGIFFRACSHDDFVLITYLKRDTFPLTRLLLQEASRRKDPDTLCEQLQKPHCSGLYSNGPLKCAQEQQARNMFSIITCTARANKQLQILASSGRLSCMLLFVCGAIYSRYSRSALMLKPFTLPGVTVCFQPCLSSYSVDSLCCDFQAMCPAEVR